MSSPAKVKIGLILPTNLEYTRQMLVGASEWAFAHPEVDLHLLSDSGNIPSPDELQLVPDGIFAFVASKQIPQITALCPHVVSASNRQSPEGADFVISDDVEVGRMAAEHLVRRGFRDLVFAGRAGHQYSVDRGRGFRNRAEAFDLAVHEFNAFEGDHEESVLKELARLKPRSGIFAANDIVARTVLHYTENPHQRVPLQYALLGVDNDPLQRALCPLPLSSIALDGQKVGYTAMERLMARIRNPELPFETIRIPPLRVEARQSTDLYALEDSLVVEALETIDEHLSHLSNVTDLVNIVDVPRRTLEYRFKKATGRTLAKELATLRIERARDLLRNGEQSVEDVAKAVGLPEARMLWLLFKRHTGETPSEYRKRVG